MTDSTHTTGSSCPGPRLSSVDTKEILIAFSAPDGRPLGNIWRITTKKTDFYLDPLGQAGVIHLSAHGPNTRYPDGHRFHVKADHRATDRQRDFVLHSLPGRGYAFDGQELSPGVFRLARIRWTWDLQRARFAGAATLPGPVPEVSNNQFAARLSDQLEPNIAADVDLVVSYSAPCWPAGDASLRNNARLGPLQNASGMWLTATSYHRSQTVYPAPENLRLPLPAGNEDPNRILCGGPDDDTASGMYWFVETITSRQLIEASLRASRS